MAKNNQITRVTRKQIANFVVAFMRVRMKINQELIAVHPNRVDFGIFMDLYDKYTEAIESEEAQEEKKILKNEDGEELLSYCEVLRLSRNLLVNSRSGSIVLSDEQIDEMMEFVRESIITCGLGTTAMTVNERDFLRITLARLKEKLESENKESEKYEKLARYVEYTNVSEKVAFCDTISGLISVGYGCVLSISNHENRPVCNFNMEGKNILNGNALDYEKIYLLKDLYFGSIKDENGSLINGVIFLKRTIDRCDYFEVVSNNRLFLTNDECVNVEASLKDWFEAFDLDCLCEPIFTERDFNDMARAYNNAIGLTDEDKSKIDKAVDVAASWWASTLATKLKFDNGDSSSLSKMVWKAQMRLALKTPIPSEDTILAFKEILSRKIKKSLLSQYYPSIGRVVVKVDYHPDRILKEAADEAKLIVEFPWKTTMEVSMDKVTVVYGASSEVEVLYSSKNEDFDEGSMGAIGGKHL